MPQYKKAYAVSNPTTVTFSGAIAGSIYCSTQDGSTPATNLIGTACSNGTLGTTTSITSAVTVKVVSGLLGDMDSAVGSAAYTISAGHSFSIKQSQSSSVCTFSSTSHSTYTCTLTGIVSGDSVIGICTTGNGSISFSTLSSTPSPVALIPWNTSYGGPFIASNVTTGTYALTYAPGLYHGTFYCSLAEVSGIVTSSPLDVYSGVNQSAAYGTGSATNQTGSVITTNANDEVCAVGYFQGNSPYSPGTGYATVVNTNGPYIECGSSILSSTQTVNPGLVWTGSTYMQEGTFALKLQ